MSGVTEDEDGASWSEGAGSRSKEPGRWGRVARESIVVSLAATALAPIAHNYLGGGDVLGAVADLVGAAAGQTVLGSAVQGVVDRLRGQRGPHRLDPADLADELRRAFEDVLGESGIHGELSALLRRTGAVEEALEVATGDTRVELVMGLKEAGMSREEYYWIVAHVKELSEQFDRHLQENLRLSREILQVSRDAWNKAQEVVVTNKVILDHVTGSGRRSFPPSPLLAFQDADFRGSLYCVGEILKEDSEHISARREKCPYMGLQAFREEDEWAFFGRDALVDRLVGRLEESRFVSVVGPSGSGKSSLVQAGLLPRLKRTDGLGETGRWRGGEVFRPGTGPIEALALAVCRDTGFLPGAQVRDLRCEKQNLDLAVRFLLRKASDDTRYLLVIDQLEEVFTHCEEEKEREHFFDLLVAAVTSREGKTSVVVTLRSDFYGRCASYLPFARLLEEDQFLVPPLGMAETRQAITQPALAVGLIPQSDLEDRVLEDLDGAPGGLPLLSQALRATWEYREGKFLTVAGYEKGGGITNAITQTAEKIWESFSSEEQEIARKLFFRLTRLGEGTEDTRRRVERAELCFPEQNSETTDKVLDRLASVRLLSLGGTGADGACDRTIEVAHEALIREWQRLRGWLEEDREGARTHRSLTTAAITWEKTGCGSADLYRGDRFVIARAWADTHIAELNETESDFLAASARQEQKARTRIRTFISSLVVAFLLSMGLGGTVFVQRNRAEKDADLALGKSLDAEAQRHLENPTLDTRIGALLAVEADKHTSQVLPSFDWVANTPLRRVLTGHTDDVRHVVFSPDGTLLATASWDGTTRLWNVETGALMHTFTDSAENVVHVAFSPDGALLATANWHTGVHTWDTATGALAGTFSGQFSGMLRRTDWMVYADFSPDGKFLAAGTMTGLVFLWDVGTGERVRLLSGHTGNVGYVGFSPDGTLLATASDDDTAGLWSVENGIRIRIFGGHAADVTRAVFSPDGGLVATASRDGTARLWGTEGGALTYTFAGHTESVGYVGFSPDGGVVATASVDGTARLWDVGTGEHMHLLAGHADEVVDVVFSSDGALLATASVDGTARLWDVKTGKFRHVLVERADWEEADELGSKEVTDVAFSPDGTLLATSDMDDIGRLWNTKTGELIHIFYGQSDFLPPELTFNLEGFVVFSPDGELLATRNMDGAVYIWDVETGALVQSLADHAGGVAYVGFSPDGTLLATASDDGTAGLWDVGTGERIHVFTGHTDDVVYVGFSPDGGVVATASVDGTAGLWDVALPSRSSLREKACRIAGRNFTRVEWERFLPGKPYEETCSQWSVNREN